MYFAVFVCRPALLPQFAVSGLVAGAALLGANLALDKHRMPKLRVDKMNSPKVVKMDLAVYTIDEKLTPYVPYHLHRFTIPYSVNRILIRNEGRTAAKNSKGILKDNDLENRVCWSVPAERSVATINAHSMEYLDLSAGLIGTQAEHYNKFCTVVNELQETLNSYTGEVTLRDILFTKVEAIKNIFKSSIDIPMVIVPTENDWQIPPNKNRVLLEGNDSESKKEFAMLVASENSEPLEEIVSIQKPDNKGKIVEFSQSTK